MTTSNGIGNTAKFEQHGGRLDEAAAAFPSAPRPWMDLSTGINPNTWRPSVEIVVDPGPLPTTNDLRTLETAAASYFGVDAAYVAAVPGSEIALRLLPLLGLPAPLTAVAPGYGTHAAVAGTTVAAADIDADRAGALLRANPNNPDGRVLSAAEMLEFARRRAERGGVLVVDEAFADVNPDVSVLPAWDRVTPLVVLRSFGKFFGLAGVRLGFVVSTPAVLAVLRRLLGDWPVSAQAIAWGRAAYADEPWIADTRKSLSERAAHLDAVLAAHGLGAVGACSLFRLVKHAKARHLFERLARAGILTRPFADQADWLRIGLPADEEGFDRLGRALAGG